MSKGIAALTQRCPLHLDSGALPASLGNRYGVKVSFIATNREISDGKIRENTFVRSRRRNRPQSTVDKIAKAAMSKEMLAAGLAPRQLPKSAPARRAARSATPASMPRTPRRKRRAAVAASATKLGALIAEAVADAAQRVMRASGSFEGRPGRSSAASARRGA